MQENTNKIIAVNSIVLYIKLIVGIVCSLLATRFALQALGVVDYGLYAVLGGIISFISIFNTIMISTSNRFIAFAIGKGDMELVNKQFNVNLIIHCSLAVLAFFVAYPLGEWYIPRYVNYDGPISNAMMVYVVSVTGSILSFIGVPYNGIMMAKERFVVFSIIDVLSQIIRLVVAWVLVSHFDDKLLIYTVAMAVLTALPTLVYIIYCHSYFKDMVRIRRVKERGMYKNVFGFSSWVAIGAITQVGKNQGASLVVNAFFNTAMNSAMGVASSISSYVNLFAQTITQPMAPQITKSFASGNTERTDELFIMSTKFSFILTFLVGSIFLVEPEWLLTLWLGDVPPFSSFFLVLLVIDNILRSVYSGVSSIIFASGRIGLYQALTSALNFLSVLLGFIVLREGAPAYYLIFAYILVSIITFFVIQYVLHRSLQYDIRKLWKSCYVPALITISLFIPILLVPTLFHPIINIMVSIAYLASLEWLICLTKNERARLSAFVRDSIRKKVLS